MNPTPCQFVRIGVSNKCESPCQFVRFGVSDKMRFGVSLYMRLCNSFTLLKPIILQAPCPHRELQVLRSLFELSDSQCSGLSGNRFVAASSTTIRLNCQLPSLASAQFQPLCYSIGAQLIDCFTAHSCRCCQLPFGQSHRQKTLLGQLFADTDRRSFSDIHNFVLSKFVIV